MSFPGNRVRNVPKNVKFTGWVSDDELFEYGKVMLGMISGAREINRILFPTQDREFKLSLIDFAKSLVVAQPYEEAT